MAKKVSLQELMGSKGASGVSLDNLPDILGDAMPELPRNQVGRFRLIRALQQRFGNGFRNLPGLKDVVKQFDEDCEHERTIQKLKAIKPQRKA